MTGVLLIALIAFACWAVSVYVYPFRHCGKCGGTGRKHASTRRRFDLCRRCSGTGRVQRIGSRTAHRTVLSVRSEIARERQRRRDRKADERATPPRRLDNRP
jgi:DnaJ-class molecular chaperone